MVAGYTERSELTLYNVGDRRTRFGRFEFESDLRKGGKGRNLEVT